VHRGADAHCSSVSADARAGPVRATAGNTKR
jgi:hypothetical protein